MFKIQSKGSLQLSRCIDHMCDNVPKYYQYDFVQYSFHYVYLLQSIFCCILLFIASPKHNNEVTLKKKNCESRPTLSDHLKADRGLPCL